MPNLKMIVDFYHMKANKEDFAKAEKYMPYVLDVHISGLAENYKRPFADEIPLDELNQISNILKKASYSYGVALEPDDVENGFSEKARASFDIMNEIF